MSKDGYYGDFPSFAEEQREYEKHMQFMREAEYEFMNDDNSANNLQSE